MPASHPPPEPLDLDSALSALARVVGRPPPPDRRVLAWYADLCRDLGICAEPLELVLPFGGLSPDGRALLALLVQTARQIPSMQAAARRAGPGAFVPVAGALAERLPVAVVRAAPLRQSELLRRWAAAVGAPIMAGGRVEAPARSARILERLDYTRIRAEETRLDAERTIAEARRAALAKIAAGGAL